MKNTLKFVFILIAGIVIIGMIGPRATIDLSVEKVSLPEDLDRYLQEKESGVTLTTDDVAKKIVWFDPETKAKTPVSIVYLHGYSATLMETHPLTEDIARQLEANVFYTRLEGHGEPKEKFAKATAAQWARDTVEAWEIGRRIGEKVIIFGVSTGATLATWLTLTHDVEELKALVFVSPNYGLADRTATVLTLPWGVQVGKWIAGGDYHPWPAKNEKHETYWMTSPGVESTAQMLKLVQAVNELEFGNLRTPMLVLYSEHDTTVSIAEIKTAFAEFGSTTKYLVAVDSSPNPSKHVLAGDIVGYHTTDIVKQEILKFLEASDP